MPLCVCKARCSIRPASIPKPVNAVQGTPGQMTQEVIKRLVDDLLLVDEGDIEQAVLMLLEIEKTLVEGAGAAGLAALLRYPERFVGQKVGLILCGGNIDPLARTTATVAEAEANIEEVHHQRAFTLLAAQNVEIELVLQTRGHAHVAQVLEQLRSAGLEAVML